MYSRERLRLGTASLAQKLTLCTFLGIAWLCDGKPERRAYCKCIAAGAERLPIEPLPVASPLLENLARPSTPAFEAVDAKKPFLVGAVPLTYGTLKDRMARLQTLFNHYGLGAGDRIVIVSGDDSSVISLYFATVRAGLVAVIGNGETTAVEVARLIAAAEPRMVFVDRAIMPIEAVVALLPENCHAHLD